jgi:hypothetical protein
MHNHDSSENCTYNNFTNINGSFTPNFFISLQYWHFHVRMFRYVGGRPCSRQNTANCLLVQETLYGPVGYLNMYPSNSHWTTHLMSNALICNSHNLHTTIWRITFKLHTKQYSLGTYFFIRHLYTDISLLQHRVLDTATFHNLRWPTLYEEVLICQAFTISRKMTPKLHDSSYF